MVLTNQIALQEVNKSLIDLLVRSVKLKLVWGTSFFTERKGLVHVPQTTSEVIKIYMIMPARLVGCRYVT